MNNPIKKMINCFVCLCILAAYIAIAKPAEAINTFKNYNDLPIDAPCYDEVNLLSRLGIIDGFNDNTFRPKAKLTRAQFIKLVLKATDWHDRDAAGGLYNTSHFVDVGINHWANDCIEYGVENDIINGYGNGFFGPEDEVTCIQAMKILIYATGYSSLAKDAGGWPDGYKQYGELLGLREKIEYVGDNQNLTREQAAIMLVNAMRVPVCVVNDYVEKQKGVLTAVVAPKDGYGRDFANLLSCYWDIYEVNGYVDGGDEFVITYARNFDGEYYPHGSKERIKLTKNVHIWYEADGNMCTAYIAEDEGEYEAVYISDSKDVDSDITDSIYELTEEHIAVDDETFVHYTDNIILAFVEAGLDDNEKETIAEMIDGTVVAQLSGAINVLEIEVSKSTYDELNGMANKLMQQDKIYYAVPDVLIDEEIFSYDSIYSNGTNQYEVDDEWWVDAIDARYVWNNYNEFVGVNTVGVIDSGIFNSHEDLDGKVFFAEEAYRTFNDEQRSEHSEDIDKKINHGTATTSIISANMNNIGITGIANKSNVVFASNGYYSDDMTKEIWNLKYQSQLGYIYALKKEIEAGAKAINCSFGRYYYTKEYFNNHKEDFTFLSYENQMRSEELTAEVLSICTTAAMCELINNDIEFLVVQSAGNGENNGGNGVDAKYGGYWRRIENNETFKSICRNYGVSFKELRDHYIVVGAVKNEKQGNDYLMTKFSNFGDTVDICAPGENIKVCNATGTYKKNETEIYNSWYNPTNGTSEAAPMVTATAALLWGFDQSLTAAQVKDYIIKGAKCNAIGVGKGTGRKYPMLNVRGAVEKIVHPYSIMIKDKETDKTISGATVVYYNDLSVTSDIIGNCNLHIPDGSYEIIVSKEGYKQEKTVIEFTDYGNSEYIAVPVIYLEKETDHKNISTGWYSADLDLDDDWADYWDSSPYYSLCIESVSDNKVTFSIEMAGANSRYIYIVDSITAEINNNTASFTWEDSWLNSGHGKIVFEDGYLRLTMIETVSSGWNRGSLVCEDQIMYPQKATAVENGNDKILNGDFSEYAGIWKPDSSDTGIVGTWKYQDFATAWMVDTITFDSYGNVECDGLRVHLRGTYQKSNDGSIDLNLIDNYGVAPYSGDGVGGTYEIEPFTFALKYSSADNTLIVPEDNSVGFEYGAVYRNQSGNYTSDLNNAVVMRIDGMTEEDHEGGCIVENIKHNSDGSYEWAIISPEYGDGYHVILYPVGVDVKSWDGNTINSDTSRPRLWMGNGSVDKNYDFYYKQ